MTFANTLRNLRPVMCAALLATAVACDDDDDDGGDESAEGMVLVRGMLASADLAEAQATHDGIAQQGEAASREAGDIAHQVLLGTSMLDSTPGEFLAIDRWTDLDAMVAFYADPELQEAFGSLFAEPPSVEFFVRAPDWEVWGEMDAGEPFDPYFFHLALGSLADDDGEAAQAAHDQVAAGGKQPSLDAGNVGHIVFLGLEDPQRFVAVDIWSVGEPIEPFYSNPMFRQAFEPLFSSVSEPVYQSTDWYQW
jgi:quinol monooxygenase YgiN